MKELTLKEFRKLQKLSQQEFANKVGYTQAHISTLEGSEREFTDEFLGKLNEVFKVNSKGYSIVPVVDKYRYNSHNINNKGNQNSTITNHISTSEAECRKENEQLKAEVMRLQKELIDILKAKR